jgi:long-chain acyl-CoA synthetase
MRRLPDLLFTAERRFGPRPALAIRRNLRTEVWTYHDLARAARLAADRLIGAGLEAGDRVLVLAPNSPELVICMFGVWLAGGVLVPIDLRTPADVIARLRERSDPRLLLADGVAATASDLPTLSVSELARTADAKPVACARGAPEAVEVAELVFTSGTTGAPKGVILTHANILSNVDAALDALPIEASERLLSLLPLSHMLEQTAGLLAPLAAGATIYYTQTLRSSAVQAAMQRHRVGLIVCVPEILRLLLAGVEREVERSGKQGQWRALLRLAGRLPMGVRPALFARVHHRLGGRLRLALCGGATLNPELWQAWESLGVRVIQGYGATECAPIVTSNRLEQRLPAAVGWPVKAVYVRIAADGEVQVRGPNVTPGYWREPDETAAAFEDGWYLTGDLGRYGARGELQLLGRKKDMIVLPDGRNVFPQDIEDELKRQPAIRDCVVLGKPRPDGGEEVHAAIIPAGDAEDVAAAVREANARLGPRQNVSAFTIWPETDFPRTPSLKVKRADVLAVVTQKATQVPPGIAAPVADSLEARVVRLVAAAAQRSPAELAPDADLTLDLGLDSLARVELAVMIEEEFGRALTDEDMASLRTIRQLAAALERGRSAETSAELPAWPRGGPVPRLRSVLQALIVFPLLGVVCQPRRVAGRRRLDALSEPLLLIANHTSHLDAPTVLALLTGPRRERTTVAAAADYFFRSVPRSLAAAIALGAFPFNREGAVAASLAHCGDLVDGGYSLLIFPEGTRSPDGQLQPFKTGIGLLARELRIPVVPIAIEGLHEILPKGRSIPRRGPVRITIGEPIRVEASLSNAEATALLEKQLRRLLDPVKNVDLSDC